MIGRAEHCQNILNLNRTELIIIQTKRTRIELLKFFLFKIN